MSQYALEARNLTKAYPGFTLGPLTLALPSGCIMGLVGENGAGKTTTIKLLTGILAPTEGSVIIGGQDMVANPLAAKRLISFCCRCCGEIVVALLFWEKTALHRRPLLELRSRLA